MPHARRNRQYQQLHVFERSMIVGVRLIGG